MKAYKKKIGYVNSALLPRNGKVQKDRKVEPRGLAPVLVDPTAATQRKPILINLSIDVG